MSFVLKKFLFINISKLLVRDLLRLEKSLTIKNKIILSKYKYVSFETSKVSNIL